MLASARSIFDCVRLSLLVSGLGRSGFDGVFFRRQADGWLATESIFLNCAMWMSLNRAILPFGSAFGRAGVTSAFELNSFAPKIARPGVAPMLGSFKMLRVVGLRSLRLEASVTLEKGDLNWKRKLLGDEPTEGALLVVAGAGVFEGVPGA